MTVKQHMVHRGAQSRLLVISENGTAAEGTSPAPTHQKKQQHAHIHCTSYSKFLTTVKPVKCISRSEILLCK